MSFQKPDLERRKRRSGKRREPWRWQPHLKLQRRNFERWVVVSCAWLGKRKRAVQTQRVQQRSGQTVRGHYPKWWRADKNAPNCMEMREELNPERSGPYRLEQREWQDDERITTKVRNLFALVFFKARVQLMQDWSHHIVTHPLIRKKIGPRLQRDSNDISDCYSSAATCIPRGWMGQFRSRSKDKLIRELWESFSIKGTWI